MNHQAIKENITNQAKIAELNRTVKELTAIVAALHSQVQIISDKVAVLRGSQTSQRGGE